MRILIAHSVNLQFYHSLLYACSCCYNYCVLLLHTHIHIYICAFVVIAAVSCCCIVLIVAFSLICQQYCTRQQLSVDHLHRLHALLLFLLLQQKHWRTFSSGTRLVSCVATFVWRTVNVPVFVVICLFLGPTIFRHAATITINRFDVPLLRAHIQEHTFALFTL